MRASGLLVFGLLVGVVQAEPPTQTPAPEDVPAPIAGGLGLAGQACPDVTRFLNVRTATSPTLSPDGKYVAFRTSISGKPQLWMTRVGDDPSWPRQLTFGESALFADWSPTGEWIAYGVDRAGNERIGFYLLSRDGTKERELLAPAQAFRVWGGWSQDGKSVAYAATEPGGDDFSIFLLDVASGKSERVYRGERGVYISSWHPDNSAVLLRKTRGEDAQDILYLDLKTGAVTDLFVPEVSSAYRSFSWKPDGSGFYVVTNQDRDLTAVAFYDLASKKLEWVETPEHEVSSLELSRDGRYLAWVVNEQSFSKLHVRDLRTGKEHPMPKMPAGILSSLEWAEQAPVLVGTATSPQVPGDIWAYDAREKSRTRLTFSSTAGLDPEKFVEPEHVSFPSFDGLEIHGLLYKPKATGEAGKIPTILKVHGGPTGQARPRFAAVEQYYLSRGFMILDLNFRGSTGYGKTFARLDNKRLRPNAVKDMEAARKWLIESQGVDENRIAVMGGSYGGYMTLAALTAFPGQFGAGVSFVGVSNWITALEGASPQLKASDVIEYGDIDSVDDREFFARLSPLTHADKIADPLMVVHGANDPRDPVTESDQIVDAVRKRNGDVEYLRFPDEGHGIRKLANRITAYNRIVQFLAKRLGAGPAACVAQ